ncbi:hypothetical protein [Longimicrobium sp.]|uniref:hypothetical protein n=1 Tax=Longimicrobium sp. TaxID=2029185 RepID=UPI002C63F85F|nr:hypothetical protein [Longimicrobium sp.]HSU15584.1 hypothetical protein [Longimicrobium sp.]
MRTAFILHDPHGADPASIDTVLSLQTFAEASIQPPVSQTEVCQTVGAPCEPGYTHDAAASTCTVCLSTQPPIQV